MNQEPLISVIVPVYNVEKYLDQCMESIVAQSYRHLEILVVDDGSTDASGTMCDQWALRDQRIRVIHQNNGGLSAARNTALDVMHGDVVMMVDSDDVLHPHCAAILLDIMRQQQATMVVGRYIPFTGNTPEWPASASSQPAIHRFDKRNAMLAVLYQQGLTHSAWGRLYQASLFNDIRYPVGMYYEDFAIIYPLLNKCETVVTVDATIYGYRQRQSSILDSFSPKRADVLKIGEALESHMLQADQQYLKAARSRLLSAYFNILLLSNQDTTLDHHALQERCWNGIKRLRFNCLMDPQVRIKNKMGILASYLGRHFLCNVVGRNYSPKP